MDQLPQELIATRYSENLGEDLFENSIVMRLPFASFEILTLDSPRASGDSHEIALLGARGRGLGVSGRGAILNELVQKDVTSVPDVPACATEYVERYLLNDVLRLQKEWVRVSPRGSLSDFSEPGVVLLAAKAGCGALLLRKPDRKLLCTSTKHISDGTVTEAVSFSPAADQDINRQIALLMKRKAPRGIEAVIGVYSESGEHLYTLRPSYPFLNNLHVLPLQEENIFLLDGGGAIRAFGMSGRERWSLGLPRHNRIKAVAVDFSGAGAHSICVMAHLASEYTSSLLYVIDEQGEIKYRTLINKGIGLARMLLPNGREGLLFADGYDLRLLRACETSL